MPNPAACIAALDEALALTGENVLLRRVIGSIPNAVNVDVICRASVRTWRLAEEGLVATVARAVIIVAISPTQIAEAQWPGGAQSELDNPDIDKSIPRRFDRCDVKGQMRNIEAVEPIMVNNVIVRYDMRMMG